MVAPTLAPPDIGSFQTVTPKVKQFQINTLKASLVPREWAFENYTRVSISSSESATANRSHKDLASGLL